MKSGINFLVKEPLTDSHILWLTIDINMLHAALDLRVFSTWLGQHGNPASLQLFSHIKNSINTICLIGRCAALPVTP